MSSKALSISSKILENLLGLHHITLSPLVTNLRLEIFKSFPTFLYWGCRVARRELSLLEVLGNETRRRILELLAKEPRYLLQLSKELNVSQQAILKHIDILLKAGLIRSFEVKSGSLGPSRKYYELVKPFSLVINVFKGYSEVEIVNISESEIPEEYRRVLWVLGDAMSRGDASCVEELLEEVREVIEKIDREIQEIRRRERRLLNVKCSILNMLYESLRALGLTPRRTRELMSLLVER
ncbi:MAG: hypothetical protein DRJ68_02600 [Thermoprotei archaeon]|nr:MAG: hypothetical protein DRJ68_02600 [Thermoprotei archaeon]